MIKYIKNTYFKFKPLPKAMTSFKEFNLSGYKSTFYYNNFKMPETDVSPHSEIRSETDILVSQGNRI